MGRTWIRIGIGLWGIVLAGLMLTVFSGGPVQNASRALADDAFSCADVTQIPQAECGALISLYASTNGDSWIDDRNWLFDDQPCFWKGVTCAAGNVTKLRLEANNLTGVLPTELGDLSELVDLDLSSNEIGGSLPAELGNLSKLQGLYLGHNSLEGAIPDEIGGLSKLDYLGLNNNRLSGSVPSALGDLASVQNFYLSGNELTGFIPPELGNLSSVQFLWLSSNQLDGPIPSELGSLSRLLQISMANNNLTGPLPATFGDLTMLRQLYVNGNALVGPLPLALTKLDTIDFFWFHDTFLCDPEEASLTAWLERIEHLRTSGLLCSDGPPATLAITKVVVGAVPESDWSFDGSGTMGAFTIAAAGETVTHTLLGGTYEVSETTQPGYGAEIGCTDGQRIPGGSVSIELAPGASAGCTFTNTAMPAQLTVVKQVNGVVPNADWDFAGSNGIGLFSLPAAGGSQIFTVAAGLQTITEVSQNGYTATAACSDGSIGGSSLDVDLDAGEETACVFVNSGADQPLPATLVITKTVVGEPPDAAWSFAGSGGIGPFTLPATGGATAYVLDGGAYTLTEAATTSFTATVACSDGSSGDRWVSVALSPGDRVGCTFRNTRTDYAETGEVRGVVYEDVNDNDMVDPGEGVADILVILHDAAEFSDTVSTVVDGVYTFDEVPVGEVTLSVSPPAGYETPPTKTVTVSIGATILVDPIELQRENVYSTRLALPALYKE